MTNDRDSSLRDDEEAERPELTGASYTGPIPHAGELAKYEDILPGAADRILAMAERESAHRMEWERSALDAGISDSRRGHYLGFIVSVGLMIGAIVCAYLDQPVIGTAMVGTSALGVVTAFIRGRSDRQG